MAQKILSKTYSVLRGFSTDSKYVRPANVSEKVINMFRLPDGTLAPRRGYQVEEDDIGGLGMYKYEDFDTGETIPVCIHRDGNLYVERTGSFTVTFTDPNDLEESYVTYEIYVDPDSVSDNQTCDFDPYLVVAEEALVDDCIKYRVQQLLGVEGEAIGSGSASYSGSLASVPMTPGTLLLTDGTLNILDDGNGNLTGDIGVGTNTINYTTGAYDVTFSGVTAAVTANYRTTLNEQFNQCLGKGYGEASPVTVQDVIDLWNGVTGITVTSTGETDHPAAFIEIEEETLIAHTKSATFYWKYWESANRTVASTFEGLAAQLESDDFRNATFAPYDELVYIGTKFDPVHKYDGQTVYLAGMPTGSTPTLAENAGGSSIPDGTYGYFITFEQVDHTGLIVEGVRSEISTITTTAGGSWIDVSFDPLVQGSGYNTNCAIVNGAQVGVNTIVVDDGSGGGHSLQVGDKAYFLESVSGEYITREITAITANSITIDGSAVNVNNNTVISNNLKVNIYRRPDGATLFYPVASIPNNSYIASPTKQTYTDEAPDAEIEIPDSEYNDTEPLREPPPATGVIRAYAGRIIYAQDPEEDDAVYFSLAFQPEYVPRASNAFLVPSNSDSVTGIGTSGSTLIIFKNRSIFAVNGDFEQSQFTVSAIAPGSNIGCISHHTIASVGGLLYFVHTNGVYCLIETQLFPTDNFGNPIPISIMIDQVFREETILIDFQRTLARATAINYTKDSMYLLYIPAEDQTGAKAGNDYSRVLAYDYLGKNWFEWTRVNAAGGWVTLGQDLHWQERRQKNDTITAKKYRQHRKYRLIDHVDHVTSTRVTWESSWEDVNEPRVRKKFVRTALLFDDISALFQQNLPTLCFYSYKNWVDNRTSTSANIMQKLQSSTWGSKQFWNWISWSGYQDTFITVPMRGGTVAKSMKIGLQLNTINTTFKLQGFQLEISPDFRKTIVR